MTGHRWSQSTLRGIVRQILSPKRAHLAKQTRTLFAERRSGIARVEATGLPDSCANAVIFNDAINLSMHNP
jgi:hypothetical protein